MPQHRCVMEFRPALAVGVQPAPDTAGGISGWSETFFRTTEEDDATALSRTVALCNLRRTLLGPGWRVYKAKVSRFPLTRTAARALIAPADGRGTGGNAPGAGAGGTTSEEPGDAIIVNIGSANGKQRNFSMRGLPSHVISPGLQYLAPANWAAQFDLFKTALTLNFALRTVATGLPIPLLGVLTATNGGVVASPVTPVLLFEAGTALVAPMQIRISSPRGMSGLQGIWQVRAFGTPVPIGGKDYSVAYLTQKRNRTVVGTYQDGGSFVTQDVTLSNIATVGLGDGTTRKTGSFPGRPRGRRSSKRS